CGGQGQGDRIHEVLAGEDRVRLPLQRTHARRPSRLPRDAPGTPRPGRGHHRHERPAGADVTVSSALTFPDLEAGPVAWTADHPPLTAADPRPRSRHVRGELPSRYASEGRLPFLEIGVRGGAVAGGLTWLAEVEFYMFSTDRKQAREVLADLFAKIGVYPRNFGGISVDGVQVTTYPRRSKNQEPDDDTYCYSGEVTVSLRR